MRGTSFRGSKLITQQTVLSIEVRKQPRPPAIEVAGPQGWTGNGNARYWL